MRLLDTMARAARGEFPPDDGHVDVQPSPEGACDAIVAFTAHSVVAAGVTKAWVQERLPREDLTGPMRADFIAALATELSMKPGSLDILLAAPGSTSEGKVELVEVDEGDSRTARARRYREEVRSYGSPAGGAVINIGRLFLPTSFCSLQSHPAMCAACEPLWRRDSYRSGRRCCSLRVRPVSEAG